MLKKRWIGLLAENEIGTLAKISGLFSGKSYNLNSLAVGTTADETVSRMTISLTSDDQTFEQVKKQLTRSIEVIKVIDFTDIAVHMKELMFIKLLSCTAQDMDKLFHIQSVFGVTIIDYGPDAALLECIQTEEKNNALIALCETLFINRVEIVRGGSVAIEAIRMS